MQGHLEGTPFSGTPEVSLLRDLHFLSFYKLKEQYARSFYEIRYSLCQLSGPKEKEEHDREKKNPCASKKSISRQKIYIFD